MKDTNSDYVSELIKNGVIAFVPKGNSMWPTLKNRKQSVIVKTKTERLRPMDVALYKRSDGTNVLHRVMETVDGGYIMCGDSQFTCEKVSEDCVYGVMTAFYKGKRCVEVTDKDYIDSVKRLFADEKRRKRRVKLYYAGLRIKSLPARAFRKIFCGKKRKKEEKNV